MEPDNRYLIELSKEDLEFLAWALGFLEGGPFSADAERKRREILSKVRSSKSGFERGNYEIEDELFWYFLDPDIVQVSKSRFSSGHYGDSVEAAFKEINQRIKAKVRTETEEELDGAALMHRAFSPSQPLIRLADLSTESGRNIQKGYMEIFAGAMTGIRNPHAHENLDISKNMAVHFLYLASLLISILQDSINP